MNYKIYFILAALFLLGGNISSVIGADDTTASSIPGKDVLTELSAAGSLVILILYIVFDFIKNKNKSDINEELSRIVVKGDKGTHSLVTQVALLQNDIHDLKVVIRDLRETIKEMDKYNKSCGSGSGIHHNSGEYT